MNKDIAQLIFQTVNSSVWFCIMAINIMRIERSYIQFRYPLYIEHHNEYIKQNRLISCIRDFFKFTEDDIIHWTLATLHYLQIMILFTSLMPLLISHIFSIEITITAYYLSFLIIIIVFSITGNTFAIIQHSRCAKIKKTNPKYSKYVTSNWKF